MTEFIVRLFQHREDAIAASIELNRMRIHERDISIFSGEPLTNIEKDRFATAHRGVNGNRLDEPVRLVAEPVDVADEAALAVSLTHYGVPEDQARRYANAVRDGATIMAIRLTDAAVGVQSILDLFETSRVETGGRDAPAGWTAIADVDEKAPAPTQPADRTSNPDSR